MSTTTRAYSLFSAEAYTTPEPTLFFFVFFFFLFVLFAPLPDFLPGKVDLSRAEAPRRRGHEASSKRQVPPERHMRIVFTCAPPCEVLYRDPILLQFVIQQNQPGRGGKAAKLVDETPFSTRSPHTTRTFVSIAPRFAISFLP